MLKQLSVILFLALALSVVSQNEPEHQLIIIQGKIMDTHRNLVPYAHILVEKRNIGAVANHYGRFEIGVYPGDTLTISAVSYHNKRYRVPDKLSNPDPEFTFTLEDDTVTLQEFVVHAWPVDYDEKMSALPELMSRELRTSLELLSPSYKELLKRVSTSGGIAIPGPFSLIYSLFSKEAKTRRAIKEILRQEQIEEKYNPDVVSTVTGINNLFEINRFIQFCELPEEFILYSTDYELYKAIKHCYDLYIRAGRKKN